jgi:hypothetical protein
MTLFRFPSPSGRNRRRGTRLRLVAAALGFACLGLPAAALMIKAPLADLVAGAEMILVGRVTQVRSSWSLDNSLIVTLASIEVEESIKGRASSRRIAVQTRGGQVGDLGLAVSDEPSFTPGETVLVFLKRLPARFCPANSVLVLTSAEPVYEILEKAQGKYSVGADGLAQKTGYRLLAADDSNDVSLPVEVLKARIRALLRSTSMARRRP